MIARLTAVVVGIDEVDADALEPQETLPRPSIAGQRRANLRVIERHRREMNPAAIEIKILAVDPEFAAAEWRLKTIVQRVTALFQRQLHLILILRRMQIPQGGPLPALRKSEPACIKIARLKWRA